MAISAKRVMSGTWGQVWVGGELWAELSAFQAKFAYNKDEVQMCGEMAVDSKISSAKGTGSITIKKVYSRTAGHADSVLAGVDERLTVIAKLDDPAACGAERVALYNVSLDEETIMDFAAGQNTDITVPFTFTRREWLDVVTA